jgi:hypothetical protein
MQQITFKVEDGENVIAYALPGEKLMEVARKVTLLLTRHARERILR